MVPETSADLAISVVKSFHWRRADPVTYRGRRIDVGYRIDLLVEDRVLVELKALTKVLPVHEAQLLSYLRLGGYPVGLLINFHVLLLRDGIRRMSIR